MNKPFLDFIFKVKTYFLHGIIFNSYIDIKYSRCKFIYYYLNYPQILLLNTYAQENKLLHIEFEIFFLKLLLFIYLNFGR